MSREPSDHASTERLRIRVKPGSRKGPLVERGPDGVLTVHVRERAIDGAANDAVIKVLAAHVGVPSGSVEITAGRSAKTKTVTVTRR